MPLRRYGRAERPVLVSADGRSPSLGLSPMSPQRGQGTTEPSTGGLPAATFGVPPDAADRGDGPMLGDWDFSASTTSQKPVPGSQSSAPPKDGKTSSSASGARSQGGPGEGAGRQWKQAATAESQDEPEVKVSAAFIGQHGQARAKVAQTRNSKP
ncbi:hypothetical protein T484DRAFT_1749822 [Baffinella frigidus]|nr:hypothetical protein T484DRAFT_1749822 [Cryptophyta sp. CCMP2293]